MWHNADKSLVYLNMSRVKLTTVLVQLDNLKNKSEAAEQNEKHMREAKRLLDLAEDELMKVIGPGAEIQHKMPF